jgi:site-specific recombinase XerC
MTSPSQSRDGTVIAIPTVKQHLASLRMLFDWLITGQVIDANPAAAVRAAPPHPPRDDRGQ